MFFFYCTALSRVHDNKHHPADVVGGTLLGGIVASLIYSIWYVRHIIQEYAAYCCILISRGPSRYPSLVFLSFSIRFG